MSGGKSDEWRGAWVEARHGGLGHAAGEDVKAELRASDIVMQFRGKRALTGVSLAVGGGSIHALIGPNGAGKSTLFSIIAGTLRPTRGSVELNGTDITNWPVHARSRQGIVRAYQVARVFSTMRVWENIAIALLAVGGRSVGNLRARSLVRARDRAEALLVRFRLEAMAQRDAGTLAQGDRKLLEILMAVAQGPRMLLLDEPTAGMSVGETDATVSLIREVNEVVGCGMLVTEHDMKVVFDLADTLSVLNQGELLCTDTPAAVRERADVVDAYLGQAT